MFPKIHAGLSQTQKAQKQMNCAEKCIFSTHILKVPCVFYPPPFVITYSFVC